MKANIWTYGLAALGLAAFASGASAQSNAPAAIPLTTKLSATTISGYVDTSAVWVPGTGNANAVTTGPGGSHADSFALDAADLKIQRAPGTDKYAAGYTFEAEYGPDAINPFGNPIRQAYVELMAPIGNGLDLEMGQFDNIIGYESNDSYKNPNWSRSYGYGLEPVSHTGLLATYKVNDQFSAQAGVVDSLTLGGNATAANTLGGAESKKGIISLVTFTAPDSWGDFKGSTISAGYVQGAGTLSADRKELYVGTTLNTPLKGFTVGASWDSDWDTDLGGKDYGYASAIAGYLSYTMDKTTFAARLDYMHGAAQLIQPSLIGAPTVSGEVLALTGTVSYQLWDNVLSRLEVRWDHSGRGNLFGGSLAGTPTERNQVLVAANVIYQF